MNQNFNLIVLILLLSIPFRVIAQEKEKETAQQKSQEEVAELAKKLANPIASLISVPFQNNTDYRIGPYKGTKNTMNFQRVVPFKLSDKLNLITRYIIPIVTQYNLTGQGEQQSGLGDAIVSAFFSPAGGNSGWTWGAGPAFLVPIATNSYLGTSKFGIGPTAVALRQHNGLTYGALINQIWTVTGSGDKPDVNQMFVQPFFTLNWKSGAGIGAVGEITTNWINNSTTSTIIFPISGVTKLES